MASAIQLAGVVLVAALALLAVRPTWRLPVLAFGLLAIPGNVDNLVPQMTLDPNNLADATAPAISVVDLLLAWCVALTLREGRRPGRLVGRLVLAATGLWIVATISAVVALAGGVELPAVVRGLIVFARIPALLYLAGGLRDELGDGTWLGLAVVAGGVGLVGNGIYTTLTEGADRFTASTFGRNGFAIVLVLATVVAAGVVFRWWRSRGKDGATRLVPIVAGVVAGACLFGSAATGTRMSLIVLAAACAAAVVAYPPPVTRTAVARFATVAAAIVIIVGSSALLTTAGLRTISLVTKPGTTVDAVIDPETVPEGSEVRSRNAFWALAIQMAEAHPLTGVGPFQWNIQRYDLDPKGPRVVADAHNAYLQIAAEYGIPTLALYLVILGAALILIIVGLWRGRLVGRRGWAAAGIAVAALVYPLGELTNSHLFNVRNGAFGWLLLAVALVFSLTSATRDRPLPDR